MAIINTISGGVNPRLWYGVGALWATGWFRIKTSNSEPVFAWPDEMYDVRLYHTANDLNFNSMDLQILHSDASLESYDVRSFLFMPFIDFYIEPYEIDSNYTPSLPTIQLKAGERYELKYTVYPGWNHTPDYSIIRHDHTLNPDNYYGDS